MQKQARGALAEGVALTFMPLGLATRGKHLAGRAASSQHLLKDTTILGENMLERVKPFAEKTCASHLEFRMSIEQWNKLTAKEKYKLIDGAIRQRINKGHNFKTLGEDKYRDPMLRSEQDLLRSEYLRLDERGIGYNIVSPFEVRNLIKRQ